MMKPNLVSALLLGLGLCSTAASAVCNTEYTTISQIQGQAAQSPLTGRQLSTIGVVTAVLYPGTASAGITLQQHDSQTPVSTGIFVADKEAAAVYQPGQVVQVSGTVAEINQFTSLTNITDITLCDLPGSINALPLRLPLGEQQQWEQFEGALVSFKQPLIVNDTYSLARYGEITLADSRLKVATEIMAPGKQAVALEQQRQQRHILVLDDGLLKQNPDPVAIGHFRLTASTPLRIGDTVSNVSGIIWQDDRGYRLVPTATPTIEHSNPRPAQPEAKPATALRIASANVLNYFNGFGNTPAFPTRRGADNTAEFVRQQAKTISALAALDADIIGLLEVENNGYGPQGALANLTTALNKVSAKPYRFIITKARPGDDDIKVAMLYRPSAVSVEGKAAILTAAPFDWGSRPPLAQSFRHLASNQLVTVSVNHFKSKGSCPKQASDANANQGDGQACWNALRVQSAAALSKWLATAPTTVKTDHVLIVGDLNAYRMEDPIRTLEQQQWQYLQAAEGGQYSYVFRGRTGSLDHALASPALAAKLIQMQHWAINADEPAALDYNLEHKNAAQQQQWYAPTPYRSSDHDPLIATFQF